MKKININQKFNLFNDHWNPKIVAELNGQNVKLAKVKGEFVWHNHEDQDELFFVYKGTLIIEFRDKEVKLNEGDMIVVPKGVDHKPKAKDEVWLILFEPNNILHTGNVKSKLTVKKYKKI